MALSSASWNKQNIIIEGLLEEENETTVVIIGKVKVFFENTMTILENEHQAIKIIGVYHQGVKGRFECKVIVRLANSDMKAIIFNHVKNLKGKTNPHKQAYYILSDLDPEAAEVRQVFQALKKENSLLEEEDWLTIKMHKNQIVVNNEKVKSNVHFPTHAEVLHMKPEEVTQAHAVKMFPASDHEVKGSEY